jgi:two-component system invasion response regulator UvrY
LPSGEAARDAGEAPMMRVLVADAQVLSRKGWAFVLAETPDIRVCAEADTPAEALEKIDAEKPDLVILDVELNKTACFDFLEQIRRLHPGLPVLVHTALAEDQYGPRVLRAGAAGFLPKTAGVELLLQAVRKSAQGGKFVTRALAEILAFQLEAGPRHAPHETLSDREYQVFCLIAGGKQVSQIAKELSLSVKTISTFRSRVLAKLAMKTNADITRYALKQGLVE